MGKKLLAVVVGMVAAFAVIGLVEGLSTLLHPMPPGTDMKDMEAFRRYAEALPVTAFLIVLAAHALGALAGGFACARMAGASPWPAGPLIIGGLLLAAGVVNLLTIPHPVWFAVVDVLLYLPMAILGGRLGRRQGGAAVVAPDPSAAGAH